MSETRAPRILALDLSLTHAGWAASDAEAPLGVTSGVWTAPGRGGARLARVRREARALVDRFAPEVAIVEAGVFRSQAAFAVGTARGVVELMLYDRGVPLAEASPASVKAFAVGGSATKGAVIAHAVRTFGFAGDSDDEADAFMLWQLARYAVGAGLAGRSAARDAAVRKIDLSAWEEVLGRRRT